MPKHSKEVRLTLNPNVGDAYPIPNFRLLFESLPGLFLAVLPDDPKFTIAAVSDGYLRATGKSREQLIGRGIFEAFEDKSNPSQAANVYNLRESFRRVIETRRPVQMPVQRYYAPRAESEGGGWEERYWRAENSLAMNESGQPAYLIHRVEDATELVRGKQFTGELQQAITDRTRTEAELRKTQRRHMLLLTLLEGQRRTSDPDVMMRSASEAVGQYLNVDRAGFFEITESDHLSFRHGWSNGRLPLLIERFAAAGFGTLYVQEVRQGRALGVSDVRTDPLTGDSVFGEIGTLAFICAPIIRNGRWHAGFYVDYAEAHNWTTEEVGLVRDLGEQTWDAVERVRAESALRRSQETVTLALSASGGVGAWDWDIQTDLVYFNRQFAEFYSVDPERAIKGLPLAEFLLGIHPDDRTFVGQKIAYAIETGNDFSEEYRVLRKDGTLRWIHARGCVFQDAVGRPSRFAGVVFDITDRREAESEVRRQWDLFDTALSNSPDVTYIFNLERQFIYANRTLLELLGKSFDEVAGKDFFGLNYPRDLAERLNREIDQVIETGQAFRGEAFFAGANGEARYYEHIFVPVISRRGQVEAVAGSSRDLTEHQKIAAGLRESNKELARANRELEEFAYVSSHDLQEPLRMVNIYTQLLLRTIQTDDPNLKQYAQFITEGVTRMELLLRDLLSFSRSVHTERPKAGKADLGAALSEAVAVLQAQIEENGAMIEAGELPAVQGDTKQLAHVFQNLISNSLKYRSKDCGPHITIGAKKEGNELIVLVRDNGIGFDPQYAERIFGLFKRLHKDEYPGTGLGLAICQRIIERYGGRIWAEGKPGEGATFLFSLPPADNQHGQ